MEELAGRTDTDIQQRELRRVEQVLRSGYSVALAIFTAFIATGVVLAFLSHEHPARKGIALALMIGGTLGHCTEALSMGRNRDYRDAVSAPIPAGISSSAMSALITEPIAGGS